MEKQVVTLLIHSGNMRLADISIAMRLDKFDTFSIVSSLMAKGRIKRHQNWLTGTETYSV